MSKERRTELRQDEIAKLDAFAAFIAVPRGEVPHDVRVLYPCWVDTADKSRLTVADKKSYGSTSDITHCPTPSPVVNAAMEIKATLKNYPMLNSDAVSEFLHAAEDNEFVFMFLLENWRKQTQRTVLAFSGGC